jgi:hypothetical protein
MPSISPVVPSTLLPSEPSGGQVTALEEYNPCNTSTGDPYDVCKNYVNHRPGNDSIYPMRWGHSGFGFRHIRDAHGFGPVTDDRIQDTIDNGNYESQTRTSYRITNHSYGCNFRVILETLSAKGVITAFCE